MSDRETVGGNLFKRQPRMDNNDQLRHHILWLLLIRVIFFTLLIGITVLLGSLGTPVILPSDVTILAFLAILFIFSIGSSAILQKQNLNLKRFGKIQFIGDAFFAALLVYGTGCSQSIFTPVFILPVIAGGLIMCRKGGLMAAAAATLFYGTVLILEYHSIVPAYMTAGGWLPGHDLLKAANLFAIYGITFFITALLGGTLAAKLKTTEEALSKTSIEFDKLSQLYKQIFDDIATGIITVDEQGNITSYNAAAGRITGYTGKDAVGKSITRLFPNLQLERKTSRQVIDLQKKDGTMIRAGYSFSRLNLPPDPTTESSGQDHCKVITLQDISTVERMEKRMRKAEKMAAIGELSASIAHDFRNPLAAISGSAQLLVMENEDKDDADKSLSKIIYREAGRMATTITEFLQFARPAPMHAEWFALQRIAEEAINSSTIIQAACEEGAIQIKIPDNTDVYGDRQQLQTVLVHLLENALIFSEPNKKYVRMQAEEEERDGASVLYLAVIDQGCGITPEIREKMFEPFYSTRENGTGLGLAIVRQIVELHNGTIEVESTPGNGCTLRVILPLPSYER